MQRVIQNLLQIRFHKERPTFWQRARPQYSSHKTLGLFKTLWSTIGRYWLSIGLHESIEALSHHSLLRM